MISWALVLLASVFLAVPGLAFSGLDPESADLMLDHLNEAELLQDGLLPSGWHMRLKCGTCKKIIQKLKDMVGEEPSEESISQAISNVCRKMSLLKSYCRRVLKFFLKAITQDIMDDKSAADICVDIKMCKPAGERILEVLKRPDEPLDPWAHL